MAALCCVSCRDPGLMERVDDLEQAEQGWFWNEQVGSYRPAGAMYCREGKVSVSDPMYHFGMCFALLTNLQSILSSAGSDK